jgi:hypothetical protein
LLAQMQPEERKECVSLWNDLQQTLQKALEVR